MKKIVFAVTAAALALGGVGAASAQATEKQDSHSAMFEMCGEGGGALQCWSWDR